MKRTKTAEEVCKEISGELEEAARSLARRLIVPELFRAMVENVERQTLKRHGFKLSSSISESGVVHFTLRYADTNEICTSMDVDPETGSLVKREGCSQED